MPIPDMTLTDSIQNSLDIFLLSWAITIPLSAASSKLSMRYLTRPYVVFLTVYKFILFVPAPNIPLKPAVPNSKSL